MIVHRLEISESAEHPSALTDVFSAAIGNQGDAPLRHPTF